MTELASVSMLIRYPSRLKGAEAPKWARNHFKEHEIEARRALEAKKWSEHAEMERLDLPDGDIGAWWACEVVLKRAKS